jgi:hypothetical protein
MAHQLLAATRRDIYDDGIYRKEVPEAKVANHLIVRTKLGTVRQTTYNLPDSDFIYGRPDVPDAENASAVCTSWQVHKPSKRPGKSSRDFIGLNRTAARSGCVTAKHNTTFRKMTQDIPQQRAIRQDEQEWPSDGQEVTYGRRNIPDGNFHTLIANQYQREWVEANRNTQLRRAVNTRSTKIPIFHTRASLGHTFTKEQPAKTPFKLKQFQNVPSRHMEVRGGVAHPAQ